MGIWSLTAAIGGVAALVGLLVVFLRYRRREITGRYLVAIVAGFSSLVAFALISAFRPDLAAGATSLIVLLPAFVAILVLVREHETTRELRG